MKPLMLAAGLCIALVNVWVLGKLAINRFVGEVKTLRLTERELVMRQQGIDNSVRSLSLVWQGNQAADYMGIGYSSARVRLDADSYQRLRGNETLCEAAFKHRQAWVLLQYGGDAFAGLLEQYEARVATLEDKLGTNNVVDENDQNRLKRARKNLLSQQQGGSRLVAVDVARERAMLKRQAEQLSRPYLILPVTYYPINKCESTDVMVAAKGNREYYLAQPYASALGASYQSRAYRDVWQKPRYQVDLAFGSLNLPWVQSLSHCQNGCELAE
ncbi:DUF4824 family protein [Gilvimarinus sp. SDUM040013]|uniref:DUF4824 family protein n=1 Tax=Gilvimarinus gilvus TaxID=3058038 RepID=A0ABU4RX81_9GAMM|nr:DUF4824 family protein [Gilvimarinus sp. SDUM040013]MDO3387837.1 DUF4824 family protein [Gilvimarinus sp. SDUM040013]MDX6848792.1 DUF4824 family protein [Gilvimarinus sp. SDUM040013]